MLSASYAGCTMSGFVVDGDLSLNASVSRGDGTSQFSASLEEHEAAVRKYQLR